MSRPSTHDQGATPAQCVGEAWGGGLKPQFIARWGEVGPDGTKKWGSRFGYPTVTGALFVEAAPEPILHPAGERPARTLGPLLSRRPGFRAGTVATAGHPWAGDGEHHATEHHQEADDREDREA